MTACLWHAVSFIREKGDAHCRTSKGLSPLRGFPRDFLVSAGGHFLLHGAPNLTVIQFDWVLLAVSFSQGIRDFSWEK